MKYTPTQLARHLTSTVQTLAFRKLRHMMLGKLILQQTFAEPITQQRINTSNWPSGLYYITIESNSEKRIEKLIVQ